MKSTLTWLISGSALMAAGYFGVKMIFTYDLQTGDMPLILEILVSFSLWGNLAGLTLPAAFAAFFLMEQCGVDDNGGHGNEHELPIAAFLWLSGTFMGLWPLYALIAALIWLARNKLKTSSESATQ